MTESASRSVHLQPRRSLSPAQELIWTSQRLEPQSPHQNMALVTYFDEVIDPARFLDAVDSVVLASDALRTLVSNVGGVPHPRISAALPAPCKVARVDAADLGQWMDERIRVPLDLETAAYESVLIDLGDEKWAWFMNAHHLVIDAGSSANLFHAVAAAYEGNPVSLDRFEDVTSELLTTATAKRVDAARDFWALQPEPRPTQMYHQGESTTEAERVSVDMASGRQTAFDAFIADARFRLLSSELSQAVALALMTSSYLARLGNDEVTIGVPIHHRSTKSAKGVIGPLVELFPLRVEIADTDTFATLHKRIARDFFKLLSNALPGTSPRQAFDVVLNVHGATLGNFGNIGASTTWIHPGHIDAHHQLRIQALDYDGSGVLELGLDINHRAATRGQRKRARHHVAAVLDAMLDDPDRLIHSVSLLDDDERLLLAPFTTPGKATPIDGNIPEVVAQRLRSHADRATIRTADGQILTADVVDEQIEEVADQLCRAGFGPGDLIGVEMGISHDAVVVIHGIQRAGAAFVPIDPAYPNARRTHIRIDSGAKLVITNRSDLAQLPQVNKTSDRVLPAGDDLAYVIYTSGSTGLPKGVPITYDGLSEYLGFAYSTYVDRTAPTMPLFTSLSFDLTITALFLPLLSGGLMTIHPDGGLVALREIVDQGLATLIKATPSHLELLVRMAGGDDRLDALSGLIVGGEAFMADLADRLHEVCDSELKIFNEYGPTEAVVGCMFHLYDPTHSGGPEVPIGRPAPGVALHVLDQFGYPVPLGVPGELHINRPGMTTGYLGRDDLNAERFGVIANSGSGDVLYSTGDLVRISDANNLSDANEMVYLGRIDEQIKVGGIRLEPGEIEQVAQSVPGVRRAVARLWTPRPKPTIIHCVRCGLPSDVPDITIDGDGVCTSCHQYELVAPQAEAWFRTEADLSEAITDARERSTGDYDVIHLISGGKDSTYALYKLVELGARVFAITLDNGFIAEVAKANVRRATAALGVDHEFVTVDGMNEIFRDSLDRFSNVCNGCYKAIYTIALAKAEELGVNAIVTGLSRGQFFETRLVPEMFEEDRFDPSAIDDMVREARHVYHTTPDAVSEHMDVDFLADGTIFDRINFIDFYRYVDVPLAEMYEALEASNTWQRPPDSGRSTNCLINSAGIFVHKIEQQHHNYAAPYSWDVRLGHKTREEALFELDDPMDAAELAAITSMLAEVGYEPKKPEILTLWIEADDIDISLIQDALATGIPAHSIPRAIEVVPEIALTANGKVDIQALPDPELWRTTTVDTGRAPSGEIEEQIAAIWSSVLGVSAISATSDFFALGGTSLHALEMIVRVSDIFDIMIPESLAFKKRTVAELASVILDTSGRDPRNPTGSSSGGSSLEIPQLGEHVRTPLSAGEQALLYEWHKDPSDPRYNVARLYYLGDEIDRERLDDAIRAVVAHQPTLHTSYGLERSELSIDAALRIGSVDSTVAPLSHLASELNSAPFDLIHGPLISVHHLTSGHEGDQDQHGLLVRTHHIVSDAGSLDVFWDQVARCYAGEQLPKLPFTYGEHAEWQAGRLSNPADLWSPDAPVAEFRLRNDAPEADGYIHIDSVITASQLRDAPAPTLFGNALASLAAALRPYHDSETAEISVTSSVRDHPQIKDVVGYFLNPLPLLISVDRDGPLDELATQVSDTLANALVHRSIPFGAVLSSAKQRGIQPPTGRIMLAVEDLAPAYLNRTQVEHEILASGTAVNDLTFFVQLRGEQIELGCEYRGAAVSKAQAETLLNAFAAALQALVERPGSIVSELTVSPSPLLGSPLWGSSQPVHELIANAIDSAPNRSAVSSGGLSLTYAQVDDQAKSIAARLRAVGVGPQDRVALCLPRSVDLIPAIYAIWMLGASYVPIDISQPATRLTGLVAASGVKAAISAGTGHAGLSEVTTVLVDVDDPAVLPIVRADFAEPDGEAYVIFTSGSTGHPKGVSITHRNLEASLRARRQWYDDNVDTFLLVSSAAFDSSIAGLFWTLADQGHLVIPSEDEVHNVDTLLELARDHGVTHTLMVPSLYAAMLQRDATAMTMLEMAIVAGEKCPPALTSEHFAALPGTQLVNEYGPTEATVWATAHLSSPRDATSPTVPIGAPIPGMAAQIVDADGYAAPIDVAGELWLTGPGISNGYLEETNDDSACFVTDRFGVRAYRTGDLAIRRATGSINFVGRIDDQLSVGGVRLEPAEVEAVFENFEGVEACLVAVEGGGLVAFVELSNANIDSAKLRQLAADRLPASHLPRSVRSVGKLPRNVNGKLDRAALDPATISQLASGTRKPPKQDKSSTPGGTAITGGTAFTGGTSRNSAALTTAHGEVTAKIVEIFSAVFENAEITPTTDFFELGGDSLSAVAVVTMVENEFGRRVAIGELVDAPTPELLANQKLGSRVVPEDEAANSNSQRHDAGAQDDLVEWLRATGSKTPLVVLPPGGGNLLRYAPLVRAINTDVPIVGIRLPGADARSAILDSIEAQAAAMLDALDSAVHSGPYRLLGWSTGGLLAWEIARLLAARGDEIEAVVLVDTVMAGLNVDDTGTIRQKYQEMLRSDGVKAVASEGARRAYERADFTLARRRYRNARESGDAPKLEDAERQLGPVIRRAAARYAPPVQNIPVVYVSASQSDNAVTLDPWQELHGGANFETITISGVHFLPEDQCIIGEYKAGELVTALRRTLDL